jgi:hypothetical protein
MDFSNVDLREVAGLGSCDIGGGSRVDAEENPWSVLSSAISMSLVQIAVLIKSKSRCAGRRCRNGDRKEKRGSESWRGIFRVAQTQPHRLLCSGAEFQCLFQGPHGFCSAFGLIGV